jgi:RecA-family ATPase
MNPTERRQQLRAAGFSPMPLQGKQPVLMAWQERFVVNDEEIALWEKLYPYAVNTGILCRLTPCLDIDVLNPDAAEAVEAMVRERFDERGYILVRIGLPPKCAIPLRTDKPFKKIQTNVIAPNGQSGEKIELLADGQQLVVFGIHPDTGKPYAWHGGAPGQITYEDLPYITEADAQQLVADAVELLVKEYGYSVAPSRPKDTQKGKGNGPDIEASADWAWLIKNVHNGHELHDTTRDLAAKLITAGTSDGAAVNFIRALLDNSSAAHDERWQERYDDIPRLVASAREKHAEATTQQDLPPLPYINMSNWDNEPVPKQEWAVLNRIPKRQCVLFSGEGGAGKSTELLHLCAAHSLAREWLGSLPEPGPAIFADAEDEENVLHYRLANITSHYQVRFADAIKGGLHLISLFGHEAVLATISRRSGKVEPTERYKQLLQAAGDIKPVMMGIAASANVFAGNEIDRAQVQQFVGLLTRFAIVANGSVVLISHPSQAGITTDSGISGSTQWHNAVRARFYLKGIKPESGEPTDTDVRELVFKKNNYGPTSESIVVRYQNGLFLPVTGVSSLDKMAQEHRAEEIFLDLLARFTYENRTVGAKPGTSYAPALFAREDEAKKLGLSSKALEAAMRRLFKDQKITNEAYGKRPSYRIVRK